MPISKKPGETKREFVSRCIPIEIANGKEVDQATAICYSIWDEFRIQNFEKQRVYVQSSNVDRVMWNSETSELVVRFHGGGTYTYKNITEKVFEDIIDGVDEPKTSGENRWGVWVEGVGPSVGATVYKKLVEKNVPFERGGSFR